MTDNNNYKMNMNGQMVGYFAIIPATIRYDKRLSPNAKLLYGEITALSNDKGFCWASNSYFAELYSVSLNSISNWLKELESAGHIFRKVIRDESKKVIRREIYITIAIKNIDEIKESSTENIEKPIPNNLETSPKNLGDLPQESLGASPKNIGAPPPKILEENNTINNTLNNTKDIDIGAREKKETVNSIIDDFTDNEELIDALKGFVEMRREIKAKLTPRAMKLALTELQKQSKDIDTQIQIVNQSVMKCWKSFFPLDDKQPPKDDRFDRYKF